MSAPQQSEFSAQLSPLALSPVTLERQFRRANGLARGIILDADGPQSCPTPRRPWTHASIVSFELSPVSASGPASARPFHHNSSPGFVANAELALARSAVPDSPQGQPQSEKTHDSSPVDEESLASLSETNSEDSEYESYDEGEGYPKRVPKQSATSRRWSFGWRKAKTSSAGHVRSVSSVSACSVGTDVSLLSGRWMVAERNAQFDEDFAHMRRQMLKRGCSDSEVENQIREKLQLACTQWNRRKRFVRMSKSCRLLESPAFYFLYDMWDNFRAAMASEELRPSVDMETREAEILEDFPHIVEVCRMLGSMCLEDAECERAVSMHACALELMTAMMRLKIGYTWADLKMQWLRLRDCVRQCRSLSRPGCLKYWEDLAARFYVAMASRMGVASPAPMSSPFAGSFHSASAGDEDPDPSLVLCKWIHMDIEQARHRKWEKFGSIMWVYFSVAICTFLTVRCYFSAECQAPNQLVTIDEGSYRTGYARFTEVQLLPRCASLCEGETTCTCPYENLDCAVAGNPNPNNPPVGSQCLCTRLSCNACGFCGMLRAWLRDYSAWIVLSNAFLDIGLLLLALICVDYPMPSKDSSKTAVGKAGDSQPREEIGKSGLVATDAGEQNQNLNSPNLIKDCVLVIPHHGPRGPLEATLRAAVRLFPAENIIVCHNGNGLVPVDGGKDAVLDTYKCCAEVYGVDQPDEDEGRKSTVRYVWIGEGNKSMAVYLGTLLACESHHRYVCVMDNDCCLPQDLHIPIDVMEKNDTVRAVGFAIRPSNVWNTTGTRRNAWPMYQDIEYKKAGIVKLFQSQMGSAMFAHGAFGMYHRETLLNILRHHNTLFNGDDMLMGLLLHRMNRGYQMKYVANVSISTRTPAHLVCFPTHPPQPKSLVQRTLAAPYHCKRWGCKHSEKSLFCQRVTSWDPGSFSLFGTLFMLLTMVWNRPTLNLKVYILHELWTMMSDVMRLPLTILALYASYTEYFMLLAVLSGLYLATYTAMDLWTFRHRPEMRSGNKAVIFYYFLYSPVLSLLRQLGMLYYFAVSAARAKPPPKLKNRSTLPPFLDGRFISSTHDDPPFPTQHALTSQHSRIDDNRIAPHIRGAKRTRTNDAWILLEFHAGFWKPVHLVPDRDSSVGASGTKNRGPGAGNKNGAKSGFPESGWVLLAMFAASVLLATASAPTTTTLLVIASSFLVILGTLHSRL